MVFAIPLQFGCDRTRMKTFLSGGRPQKVSLVPFRNRLLNTDKANQLVVARLVENSGMTLQPLVPVELTTRLLLTERLRIRIVGTGGRDGATVTIWAPKPWMEQK